MLCSKCNKREATIFINEPTKENLQKELDILLGHKRALNKLFYSRYSRFIQEGTWMSEEYVDDDKYYNDALSVMYTSCVPQVAYRIGVIALGGIEVIAFTFSSSFM